MRHALRARGVVIVSGGQTPTAFDLYTDRKLRYGLKDGGPDPATIEDDKRKLTDMVKATMESWHGRKVSPVYNLMPNLQEPDWKKLRIGDVREFWEKYDAWENRVRLARKEGHIGDVLVLAEEAPVAVFRADAWIKAGEALRKGERFRFAPGKPLPRLASRGMSRPIRFVTAMRRGFWKAAWIRGWSRYCLGTSISPRRRFTCTSPSRRGHRSRTFSTS